MLFLALGAPMLRADTIYTYTGNDFTTAISPYTTSDFVSGSFTLSAPLGDNLVDFDPDASLLSFDFSNGVQSIFPASSPFLFDLEFSTDAAGAITGWEVSFADSEAKIYSWDTPSGPIIDGSLPGSANGLYASVVGDPGVWISSSSPSPVPEPGTLFLTLGGLLALPWLARKRFGKGSG